MAQIDGTRGPMTETKQEATAPAVVPLPAPLGALASLSSFGQAGAILAAVGLMWARIDAIEARFDRIDLQMENLSREVIALSTTIQVQTARSVTADDWIELERRVTVLESR